MPMKKQARAEIALCRNPSPARTDIDRGTPLPLGASETCHGCNFSVFSRHAKAMTLVLLDTEDRIVQSLALSPEQHRTGDIWHIHLARPLPGLAYAWRADGPFEPQEGHHFEPQRLLLDPYAAGIRWQYGSGGSTVPRSLVADHRFDWRDDCPPRHPWQDTVIYEAHLRGLTIHPSSGAAKPGTYLGVVEKIPYLLELGITAVELMPVQAFNADEFERRDRVTRETLRNYWGYNPIALFAPHPDYAGNDVPGAALHEFKTMVRELHRAGIEVILDVVFNHTGEAGEDGPTYSFRGLDNAIYYMLLPDKRHYADFAGTGNTLNCNHPVVRSLIVDCLRNWVIHFHIDGFRFDLASILGRDPGGQVLSNPPLLEQIAEDPLLRDIKLIAEAWDLGGAFQVGSFPGRRWAEWNCHFRDDVRRFWRGDPGMTGAFATRLCGSADLYQRSTGTPLNSVNFITCHDGLTLNDLVSYARKHNEANGEGGRDGANENFGENNGVEGPTADSAVETNRQRQIRNMLASLLLSRGVPMILGGDEFRRTQHGNNNAYCQDNETSWIDWRLAGANSDLVRFVRLLVAFRRAHPVLATERFYAADEITWLGSDGEAPDWRGRDNRIGCVLAEGEGALCLLFNASHEECAFALPQEVRSGWLTVVDTGRQPPLDITDPGCEPPVDTSDAVVLPARSTKVLVRPGRPTQEEK